jgi:hypothetical protein
MIIGMNGMKKVDRGPELLKKTEASRKGVDDAMIQGFGIKEAIDQWDKDAQAWREHKLTCFSCKTADDKEALRKIM